MVDESYKILNTCKNCHHCFEKQDWSVQSSYHCNRVVSLRPLCGSVLLGEEVLVDDVEGRMAWLEWSTERAVSPVGVCDLWKNVEECS